MRKNIFLIAFFWIYTSSYGQLSISGNIKPSPNWESKLYVTRIDRMGLHTPALVDSIFLDVDGAFKYTLDASPQGILYELRLPPKDGNIKSLTSGFNDNWFHIIAQANRKEQVFIKGDSDSLYYSLTVSGAVVTMKLSLFRDLKRPIANTLRQMADSIKHYPNMADYFKEKYFPAVINQVEILKRKLIGILDTCKTESLIVAGLHYLNEASFNQISGEQIKKYSDRLTSEDVLLVRNIKRNVGSIERNRLGLSLQNFLLQNTHGKRVVLNSIKSKYKVIDFWASWCGPCRYANKNQLPKLNEFLNERNIPLIGVSIDKDTDKWEKAVKKDNTEWRQYLDQAQMLSTFLDVGGIPFYVVLDENNLIIFESATTLQVESFLKARN